MVWPPHSDTRTHTYTGRSTIAKRKRKGNKLSLLIKTNEVKCKASALPFRYIGPRGPNTHMPTSTCLYRYQLARCWPSSQQLTQCFIYNKINYYLHKNTTRNANETNEMNENGRPDGQKCNKNQIVFFDPKKIPSIHAWFNPPKSTICWNLTLLIRAFSQTQYRQPSYYIHII